MIMIMIVNDGDDDDGDDDDDNIDGSDDDDISIKFHRADNRICHQHAQQRHCIFLDIWMNR